MLTARDTLPVHAHARTRARTHAQARTHRHTDTGTHTHVAKQLDETGVPPRCIKTPCFGKTRTRMPQNAKANGSSTR